MSEVGFDLVTPVCAARDEGPEYVVRQNMVGLFICGFCIKLKISGMLRTYKAPFSVQLRSVKI